MLAKTFSICNTFFGLGKKTLFFRHLDPAEDRGRLIGGYERQSRCLQIKLYVCICKHTQCHFYVYRCKKEFLPNFFAEMFFQFFFKTRQIGIRKVLNIHQIYSYVHVFLRKLYLNVKYATAFDINSNVGIQLQLLSSLTWKKY